MENKSDQKFLQKAKNKTYISAGIFTIIILLLFAFVIFPFLKKIKNNSADSVSEKNSFTSLGAQVGEIEKFKSNYVSYEPNFKKIDQLYIDPGNPVEFFKFLEKIASDCKISSNVSLLQDYSKSKSGFVDLQIFSNGEFLNMLKFLDKIETGPYMVKIKNLSMKKSGAGSISKKSAPIIDAAFLIETYVNK